MHTIFLQTDYKHTFCNLHDHKTIKTKYAIHISIKLDTGLIWKIGRYYFPEKSLLDMDIAL